MKRPQLLALAFSIATIGFSNFPALSAGNDFVPSTEASRNSHVVNKGVHWYTSMEEAQVEAKKTGKLIFWMHMLGTMDGAT